MSDPTVKRSDRVRAFVFEGLGIRGRVLRMEHAWGEILARHEYSPDVRAVLGQAAAAGVLLADNLKGRGSVHLQMQGDGMLSLLLVQCDSELKVRALARGAAAGAEGALPELLGNGRMMVTIDPGPGQERYQGIVPLEGDDVAGCLEAYFRDSEQLLTRIWLGVVDGSAVGLMLQRMPQTHADDEHWQTVTALADTVRHPELAELPAGELLRRLFHEYDVRLFGARAIGHDCRCTRTHLQNVMRLLGETEVRGIIAEQGQLELNCEFCNRVFSFPPGEVDVVFAADVPESRTLH